MSHFIRKWGLTIVVVVTMLSQSTAGAIMPLSMSAAKASALTGNCWVEYTGETNLDPSIGGIGGTAWDDVWAVGRDMTHWDGYAWSHWPGPPQGYFNAVVAVARNDAWAVGGNSAGYQARIDSAIAHWNGSKWSALHFPWLNERAVDLNAISAAATDDIWVAGTDYGQDTGWEGRLILHWDGKNWTEDLSLESMSPEPDGPFWGPLFGVAAISHNDAWAVGWASRGGSSIVHWDGTAWKSARDVVGDGTGEMLRSVVALNSTDVWAAGTDIILHWDGLKWNNVPLPIEAPWVDVSGLAALAPDNIWAVGTSPGDTRRGPDKVRILHWDGRNWTLVSEPATGWRYYLGSAAAVDGDIWFAGESQQFANSPGPWIIGLLNRSCVRANQPAPRQPLPPLHPVPGVGSMYFGQTGRALTGIFLRYWQEHGGLMRFGYPISEPVGEWSQLDGKFYTVQYFERAVMEYHPENAGTGFEVLLAQLGTLHYRERYPYGPNSRDVQRNNAIGWVLFPETEKRLGGKFLDYWRKNGGLEQFGYPISDEFQERNDLDGRIYLVQYFERAVMEDHAQNNKPFDVLLTQLGRYRYSTRYGP